MFKLFIIIIIILISIGTKWYHNNYFINELKIPKQYDLTNHNFVVTGANSGLGYDSVIHLLNFNANVYMAGRSKKKLEEAKNLILKDYNLKNNQKLIILDGLDLLSFDKVKSFAKNINDIGLCKEGINGLLNNAGAMIPEIELSIDNNEKLFQINHLSPYLLTKLLEPCLINGAKNKNGIQNDNIARVTFTSSLLNYVGVVDEKAYSYEHRGGNKETARFDRYSDSKLFNTISAIELDKYYIDNNIPIRVNSASPGYVVTELDQNFGSFLKPLLVKIRNSVGRTGSQVK